MKKRRVFSLLFVILLLSFSCAIEDFNTVPNLNTPLGLGALFYTNISTNSMNTNITTNGVIKLQFWGMNNETFFSGYEIFIAESLSDLTNESNSYRVLPSINGETNVGDSNSLTMNALPVTEAYLYTFDMYYDTNMASLQNKPYYIWVKAYSVTFGNYSLPSNWTNATYINI